MVAVRLKLFISSDMPSTPHMREKMATRRLKMKKEKRLKFRLRQQATDKHHELKQDHNWSHKFNDRSGYYQVHLHWQTNQTQMSEWSLKSTRVEADNTVAVGGVRVERTTNQWQGSHDWMHTSSKTRQREALILNKKETRSCGFTPIHGRVLLTEAWTKLKW